jgi:hypothetical protein
VCGTCDVHHSCAPHALHDRQGLVQGEQGFEENIIIIYICTYNIYYYYYSYFLYIDIEWYKGLWI